MHINDFLETAGAKGAEDRHLKVGGFPVLRINGELCMQENLAVITRAAMDSLFTEVTTDKQREAFSGELESDFAYQADGVGRFRINISLQGGTIGMACRPVRTEIPTIESLGLPPVCRELVMKGSGLVIVTGPTGCGKSTTLAAMMNYLTNTTKLKIITIEDPVEFIHRDIKCVFSQRELGRDPRSL